MEANKKKLIKSLILLIVTAVFFITACITYILAWFVNSKENQLDGFVLNTSSDLDITIKLSNDGENWDNATNILLFENFFSGQVHNKSFYVSMRLNEEKNISITLCLQSPNGSYGKEEPHTSEGLYYYLGSQIQISDIKAFADDQEIEGFSAYAAGLNEYLVNTTSENVAKGQDTAYEYAVLNIPTINIIEDYLLPVDREIIFIIDFTFVDNGEDQSIYQNSENFVCKRRLMLDWEVI